jgi:hypothetical protein
VTVRAIERKYTSLCCWASRTGPQASAQGTPAEEAAADMGDAIGFPRLMRSFPTSPSVCWAASLKRLEPTRRPLDVGPCDAGTVALSNLRMARHRLLSEASAMSAPETGQVAESHRAKWPEERRHGPAAKQSNDAGFQLLAISPSGRFATRVLDILRRGKGFR